MKNKGFTLLELMITIAIIGIIVALAIIPFSHRNRREPQQETVSPSFARFNCGSELVEFSGTEFRPSRAKICIDQRTGIEYLYFDSPSSNSMTRLSKKEEK